MADKIVSPGVFTQEKDLSFLPTGIGNIGAVIVGPTVSGEAFVPTLITSMADFDAKFGGENEKVSFVPYAVREYLRSASRVLVVRVLMDGGYTLTSPLIAVWNSSGSLTQRVAGVIHPSAFVSGTAVANFGKTLVTPGTLSASGSFALKLSGSGVTAGTVVSASFNPTRSDYAVNVFGTSPQSTKAGYMSIAFGDFLAANSGSAATLTFVSSSNVTFGTYSNAKTPWITAQLMAGSSTQTLFRVESIGDGTVTNRKFKISIINTAKPGSVPGTDFGQFTVLVRDYADTDARPIVLETFPTCDLDPNSLNYIARKIGDQRRTVDSNGVVTVTGDYANRSKYVRVTMNDDVTNGSISPIFFPHGFEAVYCPLPSGSGIPVVPTASFVSVPEISGFFNDRAYYGWNYDSNDNANYCNPLPSQSIQQNNVEFNLDNMFAHPSSSATYGGASLSGSTIPVSYLKFSVPFQGGFDGTDPSAIVKYGKDITATNLFGFECSTYASSGSIAFRKAISTVSNPDDVDINLLIVPGITINEHLSVVQKAIQVCEDRADVFYIADLGLQGLSYSEAAASANLQSIDSNFCTTYYPWVRITDKAKNKPVWVPPSVAAAQVFAFNDANAFEWSAPAGLNRGVVKGVLDIQTRLSQTMCDDLYLARINPIKLYPQQGAVIWGQKNLQAIPSALDRNNVRRMLIAVEKFISSASRYLVFENNTTSTRKRFENIVNPYLRTVQERNGLYAFEVKMDDSNNTPDIIDENKMYGQIWLAPAKAGEFLIIDFNVTRTPAGNQASFNF